MILALIMIIFYILIILYFCFKTFNDIKSYEDKKEVENKELQDVLLSLSSDLKNKISQKNNLRQVFISTEYDLSSLKELLELYNERIEEIKKIKISDEIVDELIEEVNEMCLRVTKLIIERFNYSDKIYVYQTLIST